MYMTAQCQSRRSTPLNDEDLIGMSGNLRNGVPMATPVFDGAHEPRCGDDA